jgi:oxygen-independent coproporphyrinogen-3 oxidase
MCQGRVVFEAIERAHGVRMATYFAPELTRLEALALAGLVVIEPGAIQVTEAGWFLVRAVAMVFDRHLRADPLRERFSRVV